MKEQLISFSTAKLAREKGFDVSSWFGNDVSLYSKKGEHVYYANYGMYGSGLSDGYIKAPTQSLLQKWFREKHWIDISIVKVCVGSDEMEYAYEIQYLPQEFQKHKKHVQYLIDIKSFYMGPSSYGGAWYNHEEALEEGLQESLKLINK